MRKLGEVFEHNGYTLQCRKESKVDCEKCTCNIKQLGCVDSCIFEEGVRCGIYQ